MAVINPKSPAPARNKIQIFWPVFKYSGSSAFLRLSAAKQAAILKAEGEKEARIMAAEAEAQAILQVQTALADSLKLLNEAAPNAQVVKLKALEAMEKVADGKATKLIVPSDMQNLAATVAAIQEISGGAAK